METVRAELVSTLERFNGIRLAVFSYKYVYDGLKHADTSFNLVTEDHDLKIVWKIVREYSQCNYQYKCRLNSFEVLKIDKQFFGNFLIREPNSNSKITRSFDSNSLPLREINISTNYCDAGGSIIVEIQVYHQCQISSLTLSLTDKLSENKNLLDVIFIIGDEEIPANKSILSLYSDVFAKMFESDMIEKKSGKVEITDIEPEVFKMLLQSILSGKLDCNDFDELLKLSVAADKYEFRNLVDICAYRISYELTVYNVIDILKHANQVRSDFLIKECIRFITKNKETVVGMESYENLSKSGRTNLSIELKVLIESLNL